MASSSLFAQGHSVLFQKLDQILTGDTTVLRAGDAVAFKATGIEPLADRAGGHFTDLRDLSSSEDLHRRLSSSLSLCRCRFVRGEEAANVAGAPACARWAVSFLRAGVGRAWRAQTFWVGAERPVLGVVRRSSVPSENRPYEQHRQPGHSASGENPRISGKLAKACPHPGPPNAIQHRFSASANGGRNLLAETCADWAFGRQAQQAADHSRLSRFPPWKARATRLRICGWRGTRLPKVSFV
jgi:hypothetical protein